MATGSYVKESIVHAAVGKARAYSYRAGIGLVPSSEWDVFFDDFDEKIATNVPTGWTAAIIDTGATLAEKATAGFSSTAEVASDGTSEGVSIYLPKQIQLTAGKKFMMEVRVRTSLAAETDVQFGLSDLTGTTNPEDLWTTTAANLVAFGTLAGSATLKLLSDKSNSGTSAQSSTTHTLADTTWTILAILYDGVNLTCFKDGQLALTYTGAASTIPTGVALAPFFGARTGATAGNLTQIDYFRFAAERV